MTVRIGVLGVGRIGKMHAELVASQVPGYPCRAALARHTRPASHNTVISVSGRAASRGTTMKRATRAPVDAAILTLHSRRER